MGLASVNGMKMRKQVNRCPVSSKEDFKGKCPKPLRTLPYGYIFMRKAISVEDNQMETILLTIYGGTMNLLVFLLKPFLKLFQVQIFRYISLMHIAATYHGDLI